MNILFIVPYVPDLVRVRPYNLIRNLTEGGHQVTVLTLWSTENEFDALERLKKSVHEAYGIRLTKRQVILNCATAAITSKPLQAAYCWQPDLAKLSGELIAKSDQNFDIIHVEHLRGVCYGLHLKSILDNPSFLKQKKPKIIWDSVDCISLLFKQASVQSPVISSRIMAGFEINRTQRYEKWLLSQFNQVLVTSPIDKRAFEEMRRERRNGDSVITVLPNGVDLGYFKPDTSVVRDPATLVLTGKMSYHANVTMVKYMVSDILPIIWSKRPDVKIYLVGKDPPETIRLMGKNSSIIVTGSVDDIRPYLHKATIAVAPITYGVGIQNKVLEAMACGTPVITSPQGVSALSVELDKDLLVADDPINFAQKVLNLLENPKKQEELGKAGRKYVELNHDWAKIEANLIGLYRKSLNQNNGKNGSDSA